jgi:cell pole-organizing protein PopZ
LSPHTDAVVSGAFNQLATTMLRSGSARTLDDLVEDMLRPMLGSWLDVNLPPLVEKLVREQIERLSCRSR